MVGKKKVSIFHAITPITTMVRKTSVIFLIVISLFLVFLTQNDILIVQKIRNVSIDVVVSIYDVLSHPVQSFNDGKKEVIRWTNVYKQNAILREQNKTLQQITFKAWKLERENTDLRKQLKYIDVSPYDVRIARVVGGTALPYRREGYINAGKRDGIRKGQIIRDEKGLLGRLQDVGYISSRVAFITDINSRIPVVTGTSRQHAIASGNNGKELHLLHFAPHNEIEVGELVVTSGDGNFFPPNIPVGIISKVRRDNITLIPLADIEDTDYVQVVDNTDITHSDLYGSLDNDSAYSVPSISNTVVGE